MYSDRTAFLPNIDLPLPTDPPKIFLNGNRLDGPLRAEGDGEMFLSTEGKRTGVHEDFGDGRNRLRWKTVD